MKTIVLILVFFCTFVGMYFLLSLVGLIWYPYIKVIQNLTWATIYCLFIGWWIALMPTMEYYSLEEDYFNKVF